MWKLEKEGDTVNIYEIKARPYGIDKVYILGHAHFYGDAKTAKAFYEKRYPHFKEIWIEKNPYKSH